MPEAERNRLIILSGPIDSGKTSSLIKLTTEWEDSYRIGGALSPKLYHNGEFLGYNLVLIGSGKRMPLGRLVPENGTEPFGRFHFHTAAFRGLEQELNVSVPQLFILDEIGPLELQGGGFAPFIPRLLSLSTTLLLVVRDNSLAEMSDHFQLAAGRVVSDPDQLAERLQENII